MNWRWILFTFSTIMVFVCMGAAQYINCNNYRLIQGKADQIMHLDNVITLFGFSVIAFLFSAVCLIFDNIKAK